MRSVALSCLVFFISAPVLAGGDWPQWRGPTLDGVSSSADLPVEWSEEKNVLWKAALPSWSAATPIVSKERVFVMSASKDEGDDESGRRSSPGGADVLLLCLDKQTGKLLWQRKLDDGNKLYRKNNMASPSPVTDGRHVWALTGTGVLTAFDLDGERKWQRDLQRDYGEFGLKFGYASSPLLYNSTIIVQVLHGTKAPAASYIVAFDAATGEVRWHQRRETDAKEECPDAYTTPTISRCNGRVDLIISGGDYVTGHDPGGGREIWRAGGLNPERRGNYRICCSPVPAGELLIVPSRVKPVLAVRGGGTGDVTDSHVVWKLEQGGPDVPTPVSDGKYVYIVNDKGMLTCVSLKTGVIVRGPERVAQGTVSASPLLVDDKLYITSEAADTVVLRAGPEFKVLATNDLDGDLTMSSLATSDGRIYLRTSAHLYCIGEARP